MGGSRQNIRTSGLSHSYKHYFSAVLNLGWRHWKWSLFAKLLDHSYFMSLEAKINFDFGFFWLIDRYKPIAAPHQRLRWPSRTCFRVTPLHSVALKLNALFKCIIANWKDKTCIRRANWDDTGMPQQNWGFRYCQCWQTGRLIMLKKTVMTTWQSLLSPCLPKDAWDGSRWKMSTRSCQQ